jgi:hypothetical protein
MGTRTLDLPACSIVPQPTTLPRAPVHLREQKEIRFGGIFLEYQMDGTGSRLCPMAGFVISGVVPSDSATRDVVNW